MYNKQVQVQDVITKLETLIYHVSDIEDYEGKKLQAILNEQEYQELHHFSLSLAECHVIDCIERSSKPMNATAIAKQLKITKGGISKITARLIKKDMIIVQRLANNQKETFYSLTVLGKKVFRLHEAQHEKARGEFAALLSTYSSAELVLARKFVSDLIILFRSTVGEKND